MTRIAKRLKARLGVSQFLFLVSLVIMIIGLLSHFAFGFQPFFMDEMPVIRNQLRFVGERTLVPDHAKYPTFFYYLSLPATAGSIAYEFLLGEQVSIEQVATRMFLFEQRDLAMGARLFNIIAFYAASAITSAVIWRHISPVSAALAFLLLTSAPGMLQYSAYALPDVTLILMSATALWLLYKVEHPDDYWFFFLSIAFIGLAISTKYNAASLLLPAAVWGVAVFQRAGELFSRQFFFSFGISVAVLLGSFLIGSPGWVLDPDFFLAELRFEIDHAGRGHLGTTGIPILGQFELLLTHLPVLFLLSVPGVVIAWRNAPRTSLLPISVVVGTLALAAGSAKQSFHYLFPAIPGFVILAGYTIAAITARFRQPGTGVLAFLALASVLVSSYLAVQYLRPNTTALAKAWIVENIPEAAPIVTAWAYVPQLYSKAALEEFRGRKTYKAIVDDPLASEPSFNVSRYEYDFARLEASDAEYLVTSSDVFDRFFEFGIFTRIEPTEGEPLFEEFRARREFYCQLFASSTWKIVFDAATGNGPRTLVFQRTGEDRWSDRAVDALGVAPSPFIDRQ